ncbi:permease [Streptococcus pneumoniae]|nr:permease [Streptococcus pneumoniae]VRK75994.1 permease [Streptococcus pneumoniae]VRM44456.1 permease [Streptococcus pneumoniae]VSU01862.1 permease [Streptococcus pneumoniae]
MLRLVYYQFLHNKKQWLGVSPVIFVSSLVMGLAVNGVINVENNSQVFVGLPDPKPIFMFPIVFGGVTLFFVLSNIINMLVEIFRDDYELFVSLLAFYWWREYMRVDKVLNPKNLNRRS